MTTIDNPGTAEFEQMLSTSISVDGSSKYIYRVRTLKTSSYPFYRQIAFGQAEDAIYTRVSTNSSATSWGAWKSVSGKTIIWAGSMTLVANTFNNISTLFTAQMNVNYRFKVSDLSGEYFTYLWCLDNDTGGDYGLSGVTSGGDTITLGWEGSYNMNYPKVNGAAKNIYLREVAVVY